MLAVYMNATVLDGTKEMRPKPNCSVIVEDGIIKKIQVGNDVPVSTKVINLTGKWLMPGLINAHCHLPGNGEPQTIDDHTANLIQKQLKSPVGRGIMKYLCAKAAKTELLSGTTTIRTVGGLGSLDAIIRDEIKNGKRTGSRILAANEAISVPGGHMAGTLAYISHSAEESVQLVHKIAEGKPDLIKLMITGGSLDIKEVGDEGKVLMTQEQIRKACKRAHELGVPVAAHVQSNEGIKVALENGVDTIEHGSSLNDEIVQLFKRSGAAMISTVTTAAIMASLPREITGISEVLQKSCHNYMKDTITGFKRAIKEGIPVGMGLDNGSPYVAHYSTWRELEFFSRYIGVTREFALYTATLSNARILGLGNRIGSIEEGKAADFLITDENPLDGFQTMSHPYMVVKGGINYKRPKFRINKKYEQILDSVSMYDKKYRAV